MYKKIVQRGTKNEFPLRYTLEGNLDSKNLLVMIHSGGMDHHEQGYYQTFDQEGHVIKNDQMKAILTKQHIGNYDRIVGELEASGADTLIVRPDLRNHGESILSNGMMDTRDTSIIRYADDILDLIYQISKEHDIETIHLMGTCLGGLIAECIVTGTTTHPKATIVEKIRSIFLNCPFSFQNLISMDPTDTVNYQRNKTIFSGKQYTKIKGMFDGKKTFKEALQHLDMPERFASILNVEIFYLYAANDWILKESQSTEILNRMRRINSNIKYYKMTKELSHGYPDHCLWTPQCSDLFLRIAMNFYHNVLTKQDNYTQVRKK